MDPRPRNIQCEVCGAVFRHKSLYHRHLRVHYGERPKVSCEICEKKFEKQEQLRAHMYWHAGGSPHMCGFCSRWFNTENQLAYHEKQHMRETFECEECGRKFHDEDNLNFHRLVHRANPYDGNRKKRSHGKRKNGNVKRKEKRERLLASQTPQNPDAGETLQTGPT